MSLSDMAATKRRKAWWHLLRGPRGHRGLPGQPGGKIDYVPEEMQHLQGTVAGLIMRMEKAETRIADLERKLGGSQK